MQYNYVHIIERMKKKIHNKLRVSSTRQWV